MAWVRKWQVPSSSSDAVYTVALDEDGVTWGCSCPQGKFKRAKGPCKHVRLTQTALASGRGVPAATHLPDARPSQRVEKPPVVMAAPVGGERLRNIKQVLAEQREGKEPHAHEDAVPVRADAGALIEALDWE